MALAILNLATLPVKFAIPILAGLAAGTGAVAAYVASPAAMASTNAVAALPAPAATSTAPVATEQPGKPATKPSCERETWPYIDNRCLTRRGNEPERKVRLVMAPRESDAAPNAASPDLVTSNTVLRGPGVAPEASKQPVIEKPPKRSDTRRSRGRNEFGRVYSVPLPRNTYSSRF